MEIDKKYKDLLLEALEDLMYKTALELSKIKSQSITKRQKELGKKQKEIEKLQHLISVAE